MPSPSSSPSSLSHHVVVCPYAASLSDDDDEGEDEDGARYRRCDYLAEARNKCPAFANNAPCPFRDAHANPESLVEVMKKVPPSHYSLAQIDTSGGNENGKATKNASAAATYFQLAMEHIHAVSSTLMQQQNLMISNDNNSSHSGNNSNGKHLSNFIVPGGCPFKAYHHQRHHQSDNDHKTTTTASSFSSSSRQLHLSMIRAMEDFSVSAIMGRMATENNDSNKSHEGQEEERSVEVEVLLLSGTKQHVVDKEGNNDDVRQMMIVKDENGSIEQPLPSATTATTLLSQALKSGTAKSHTAAENVHFVQNFINGVIDRELYKDMITGLYHIYSTLETLLEKYAPSYFPTLHFPTELSRVESLREDMEYWHGLDWENRVECSMPSSAVQDYMDRMNEVARLDPLLLLSHAYTRYLGDLSGGKVLSRIARRALHLGKKKYEDGDCCNDYDGLQFYHFDNIPSAKLFKDKYRAKLDELPLSSSEVSKLVAEANVAFALNMRVFEELDVKGGVVGARVRNVREALAYYDIEMKSDESIGEELNEVDKNDGEEAKCPFGFSSGPNPHQRGSAVSTKELAQEDLHRSIADTLSMSKPSSSQAGEEGRCPWPFIFFHDPMTGMKDWQTWFAIGIALCLAWSCVNAV